MSYLAVLLLICTSGITISSSAFGTDLRQQFGILKQQQQLPFTLFYKNDWKLIRNRYITTRGGGVDGGDDSKNNYNNVGILSSTLLAATSSTNQNTDVVSITDYITIENLSLLSGRGRAAIENLIQHDKSGVQQHVYSNWPDSGIDDDGKRKLCEQV
jgi:hypothetical protein